MLTLDHINNDGAEHRRRMVSKDIVLYLIRNNFPEGFQILCYNCNCIKSRVSPQHFKEITNEMRMIITPNT